MPVSPAAESSISEPAPAGGRRPLIILIAVLGVLGAFLLVTKVVMAPTSASSKSTPATTVPVTHGIVRTVAGAASAAAKKLDSNTAADPTQTATTTVGTPTANVAPGVAGATSGPQPDTVRNPFQQ